MKKIGMFFGTETGTTRLVAKKIFRKLGEDIADAPINVNRIAPEDMLGYDALILGTPSYGNEELPGRGAGCEESNWEEFFARFDKMGTPDFSGTRIALFGLGAQERYAERFCGSLMRLYERFHGCGAEIVGDDWSTEGYTFTHSAAVANGRFVGLVIDQRTQGMLTDARIDAWLARVLPLLKGKPEG